ncbi:hypothetical protein LIER_20982 [Lithospermum erythrorhizon]|uniref:Integrase catalytic domain-containing protein n=1 Tax=Lithospermum erythrorhizon TaxID=34254 RepID=A0AAV3QRN9_LITER
MRHPRKMHGSMCGSHINGKALTQKILRSGIFWPSVAKNVQDHVRRFDALRCGYRRRSPEDAWGQTYTIMAMDYFIKWVEAKPLIWHDQDHVYQFLKEIFTRFEVPLVLVTDSGMQFTAGKIEGMCLDLDIEHRTASVSYP